MVRNLVVLGGSSHPQLTEQICNHLGIPPAKVYLGKFSVGETRVEIEESVRGKDVYVIQSGGGKVNDHLMELFITVSACKIASANRVTVILPLFPYSRQRDAPFDSASPPAVRATQAHGGGFFTFDQSRPQTPYAHPADRPKELANGAAARLNKLQLDEPTTNGNGTAGSSGKNAHFAADGAAVSERSEYFGSSASSASHASPALSATAAPAALPEFEPQPGYRQWVVQSGKLIADLLTSAGADHVITMDLHDPQYQGFFDIPVDNLYGRHLLKRYIQYRIPNHQRAVIVSPDAGGAKRATAIADALGMPFALIHKVHSFHILFQRGALLTQPGTPRDAVLGAPERDHDACRGRGRPHRHPRRRHGRHVPHHRARGPPAQEGGRHDHLRAGDARHPVRRRRRARAREPARQAGRHQLGRPEQEQGAAWGAAGRARGRVRVCRGLSSLSWFPR
jgi:ribose-phosphate pyrophosphokinase